ncbi:hypothetical protein [Curvivirga sp.]|uniref:hypothetical protein n=1 Tax=Curvivirga sp. TaxID=2856848 RepID=UPI003B5B5C2F
MKKIKLLILNFISILIIDVSASKAEKFILGLQNYDQQISSYQESVVELALQHIPGSHSFEIKRLEVSQDRIFRFLEDENSEIDFSIGGYSRDKEQRFLQLDIPISRGILGYRIFAIRDDSKDMFHSIETLEDLKGQVVVGSGIGWPDTEIFRANGFRVEAASYRNLWLMLAKGRYDAFNRGIGEAYLEINSYADLLPNLTVDDSLMVHYPYGQFFYFKKSAQRKHDLLMEGIQAAYDSGAYMKLFNSHPQIRQVFEIVKPTGRKNFEMINPEISDRIKAIPAKYWHKF